MNPHTLLSAEFYDIEQIRTANKTIVNIYNRFLVSTVTTLTYFKNTCKGENDA